MMRFPEPERASGALRCLKMHEEVADFDGHLSTFQHAVRERRPRVRVQGLARGG